MMNFGPHFLTLLESTQAGLYDPKILWGKVQKQQRYGDGGKKTENPHFLETGELWSTYFDTFGKPSGRATSHQNFVGQSSKTAEISRGGQNTENPHYLEN